MRFTCVDGFSGAGGLSLGLSEAGFEVLLSFDIEKRCIETLQNNPKYFTYPALCEDIRNMLGGRLLKDVGIKKGELFLLAGVRRVSDFLFNVLVKMLTTETNWFFFTESLSKKFARCFFLWKTYLAFKASAVRLFYLS
jgi:hypothetical protein